MCQILFGVVTSTASPSPHGYRRRLVWLMFLFQVRKLRQGSQACLRARWAGASCPGMARLGASARESGGQVGGVRAPGPQRWPGPGSALTALGGAKGSLTECPSGRTADRNQAAPDAGERDKHDLRAPPHSWPVMPPWGTRRHGGPWRGAPSHHSLPPVAS